MLAGDKITLESMNLRFKRLARFINDLPPQKIVMTTGQLQVYYTSPGLTYTLNFLNTTTNQKLPFSEKYVKDLLDL